ncbi:hypothetical protein D3C72_2145550 [compost metagenome]
MPKATSNVWQTTPTLVPTTTNIADLRPWPSARLMDRVMSGPGVKARRRPAAEKASRVAMLGRKSMGALESRMGDMPVYPAFEVLPMDQRLVMNALEASA